jgi:hypothetical protein
MQKKQILHDAALVLACFLASGLYSIYAGQDCNWDLKNYHFYNAYAFLYDRLTFDIVPAQLQTFLNPLMDLPFYYAIMNLQPIAIGFLVGGLQGLNIWLTYKISYLLLADVSEKMRHVLCLAAGITGYLGAANLSEVGTSMGDNVVSLFVLGALLVFFSSLKPGNSNPLTVQKIILCGLLLGVGMGLKMTAAIYAFAFMAVLLFAGRFPLRDRLKTVFWVGLGIFIGIALSLGYWMITLWNNYQNPIFPFYNKIFRSEYYGLVNFADTRFLPRNLYQKLFYPFYFTLKQSLVSEVQFRDIRFAVCYILLVLILFKLSYIRVSTNVLRVESTEKDHKFTVMMAIFLGISYALWQMTFSIYRYIVPLEYLSPIFILLAVRYLSPSLKSFLTASLALFAAIILTVYPLSWGRAPWGDSYFGIFAESGNRIEQSTVLMAYVNGTDPSSYVIPFFPKTTRFINISSNFALTPKFQARIRSLLDNAAGPQYILLHYLHKASYDVLLRQYNLAIDDFSCSSVYAKLDRDLAICRLKRVK